MHAFMIDTLLDLGSTDPLQLFVEYFLTCNSFMMIKISKYKHNLVFHYNYYAHNYEPVTV